MGLCDSDKFREEHKGVDFSTVRFLDYHDPCDNSELMAVKMWRDERKKASVTGTVISSLGSLFFLYFAITSEQKGYAVLLLLIFAGALAFCMYQLIKDMSAHVMVAKTIVLDKNTSSTYVGKSVGGRRTYYATVCQKESRKIVENVSVSQATYTFCSEGNVLYVIKNNNQYIGINGYDF